MTDDEIINNSQYAEAKNQPAQQIIVIGVGGGGNNAVDHMFRQGIKDVSFVLINTDLQALETSEIPTRIVIGPGRGAGGKPGVARDYAEADADKIASLFSQHTDMAFITAGMGGGTGTGAGPVVARIAKEMGILTVGIVTIPFLFEGRQKVLKALEGAKEIEKNVDALLIIQNQRLTEIYPDLDIFNAFAKADDTLLNAAQGITEIITNPGKINRDFNDVDSCLRDGGSAIISSGYGEGENRVQQAIDEAIRSPLLKNTDIYSSKRLLVVLYVDSDPDQTLKSYETDQILEFQQRFDPEVESSFGLYRINGLGGKVKITILASGFEASDLNDNEPARQTIDTERIERINRANQVIAKAYGTEATEALRSVGHNVRVLKPDELDDDAAIAKVEQTALNRSRRPSPASKPATQSPAPTNAKTANKDQKPNGAGTIIDFSDLG